MGARHGLVADTQRFNAYKSAVEQAGLEIDGKWVFRGNVFMAPSFETIEAAFLDPHRPDAFFVLNDSIAIHLVKVLEKIGVRVPDDVAVVGMGDLPISEAYGLTTMSEPLEELGKESAKLLTQLIENPNTAPSHRRIECNNLIVRRTAP
jgi:LacI family transcriptional regulator